MLLGLQKVARLIVAVAAFTCISAASAIPAFAQTTGVGDDEETSLMWKGFDSSVALWRLDPSLTTVVASQNYGPYIGYTPIALTTDLFSESHIAWSYTDGSISLWTLDSAMNYLSSETFGPYAGWNVTGLSADPFSGSIRLVWRNTNGSVSIWAVNSDGNIDSDILLGPLSGYLPSSRRRAVATSVRKIRRAPSERYVARGKPPKEAAAAAMEAHRQAVSQSHGLRVPEQPM